MLLRVVVTPGQFENVPVLDVITVGRPLTVTVRVTKQVVAALV